jgi:MFS family permease
MKKWLPLVSICVGTFMLLLDVTIVNVALPDMARELSTSFSALQWVIDIYALALAAVLLGAGTIADRLGHRRIYLVGLVLFALASLASGLAPSSAVLITARGVQGIGGAAMFATTFALLNSSYQGRDRGTAYGLWGAVSGASAALGPVLGGVLTQGLSWRWIFFVNLPVSVVAVVLCLRVLDRDHPRAGSRLDLPGMASFTVFTAGLTYALIRANEQGWTTPMTIGVLTLSALALVTFLLVEIRAQRPMLDLGVVSAPLVRRSTGGRPHLELRRVCLPRLRIAVAAVGARALPDPRRSGDPAAVGGLVPGLRGDRPLPAHRRTRVDHRRRDGADRDRRPDRGCVGRCRRQLDGVAARSGGRRCRGGMAAGTVNTARQLGFALGIAVLGSVFRTGAGRVLGARSPDTGLSNGSDAAALLSGGQAHILLAHATPNRRGVLDQLLHQASAAGLSDTMLIAGIAGLAAALIVLITMHTTRTGGGQQPADRQRTEAGPSPLATAQTSTARTIERLPNSPEQSGRTSELSP